MNTEHLRKTLNDLINRLCAGDLSVADFKAGYYDLQLETPCDDMSDNEQEYYGGIREQLDWTMPEPGAEDRAYGVLDEEQFRQHVRDIRERFERSGSPFG